MIWGVHRFAFRGTVPIMENQMEHEISLGAAPPKSGCGL